MIRKGKSFGELTAIDVMTAMPSTIPEQMSLPAAARLLAQDQISGAPVVDASGKCVGVFSSTDIVRWAQHAESAVALVERDYPCLCEWQVLDPDKLPIEEVRCHMTRDPVTCPPETSIFELARMMRDAHIHRVIVVDALGQPTGVVSSMDLLAAVAFLGADAVNETAVGVR
jgi:CBS domain-containing protein